MSYVGLDSSDFWYSSEFVLVLVAVRRGWEPSLREAGHHVVVRPLCVTEVICSVRRGLSCLQSAGLLLREEARHFSASGSPSDVLVGPPLDRKVFMGVGA